MMIVDWNNVSPSPCDALLGTAANAVLIVQPETLHCSTEVLSMTYVRFKNNGYVRVVWNDVSHSPKDVAVTQL